MHTTSHPPIEVDTSALPNLPGWEADQLWSAHLDICAASHEALSLPGVDRTSAILGLIEQLVKHLAESKNTNHKGAISENRTKSMQSIKSLNFNLSMNLCSSRKSSFAWLSSLLKRAEVRWRVPGKTLTTLREQLSMDLKVSTRSLKHYTCIILWRFFHFETIKIISGPRNDHAYLLRWPRLSKFALRGVIIIFDKFCKLTLRDAVCTFQLPTKELRHGLKLLLPFLVGAFKTLLQAAENSRTIDSARIQL